MKIRFTYYTISSVKVHQVLPLTQVSSICTMSAWFITLFTLLDSSTLYEVKSPFLDVTWVNTPFCNHYVNSFQGQNCHFVIYEKIYNLTIKYSNVLLKINLKVLTIKMAYHMLKSNHWINYSQVKIQLLYVIPMIKTRNMWLQLINCDLLLNNQIRIDDVL